MPAIVAAWSPVETLTPQCKSNKYSPASIKENAIIIVYYAEAAENIKHTHTIHAYTIKQFKHTNKNTYYVYRFASIQTC